MPDDSRQQQKPAGPEPASSVPAASKPLTQRPELPEFWDLRFDTGVIPWNAGGVPAEVPAFAQSLRRLRFPEDAGADAAHPLRGLRILIPGCGHAFEAACLAALGGQVTALDFSAAAIAKAREVLGDWPGALLHADFFAYDPPSLPDLIYERAFLCALPRKCWRAYAAQTAALLPPGAILAGFFFYGEEGKGPPFAAAPETLRDLLGPFFACLEDRPSLAPLPMFPGERWQVWRRKG